MDKSKVIENLKQVELYINKLQGLDYTRLQLLKSAIFSLHDAQEELKKPTLDDYIQALPYLTFDEAYGEDALKVTDNDWAYAPSLYKFEGKWLVDWVGGEEHDSGKVIEGSTPLEAARNAYNYCVNRGFIKDTLNHG